MLSGINPLTPKPSLGVATHFLKNIHLYLGKLYELHEIKIRQVKPEFMQTQNNK